MWEAQPGLTVQAMRNLLLIAAVTTLVGGAAPIAGAKTAPLRQAGSTVDHGRAGGTWTAWKVKGVQVGLRLSAVTFANFSPEWTEGHSFDSRIGLKCKSRYRGVYVNGFRSARVLKDPLTVGVPVSVTVPRLSARCLPPAKYVGYSFIGGVVKPYFHSLYSARFAGTGTPNLG